MEPLRRLGAASEGKGRVPSKAIHIALSAFLGGEDDDDSLDPGSKAVEATVED